MLPAFNTRSGVPLAWVNLLKGEIRRDVRHTCTAGAGTLLLEFATLSRLTVSAKPHMYTQFTDDHR
jgi:mannosidase alpha-like ER degradation enhancer 1